MRSGHKIARPKVLVALDGSPAAATALPIARTVAAQLGADVEALYVAPEEAPDPALWRRLRRPLEPHEVIQIRSRAGDPAAGILEVATLPGLALLVLTTHGRRVERGRALAHVAEAVAAGTDRPVLLVRPEAAGEVEAGGWSLRKVLIPVDGTPTTAALLRPATELAGRLGLTIDLLYVAGPDQPAPDEPGSIVAPCYVDQAHHEWPHWAGEVIDRLCTGLAECPAGVPVRMFLTRGDVGEEIGRFAVERGEDLIVLARRSKLEPGRGHVLRYLLDSTPCPVLLVGDRG
jgi:nucleotide-binding universal stress UspA family protein